MPRKQAQPVTFADLEKKRVSFAAALAVTAGTVADWPHFARWHYRSHRLGFVRRVNVLWHGPEAVGVCVFATPAAAVGPRSRVFGLPGAGRGPALAALNEQLWLLQRVVLHPTYRGAGVAADFVRRCCELCPVRWVETLSAMGRVNPVFERAGFARVGVVRKSRPGRGPWRFSEPVYYLFENRPG